MKRSPAILIVEDEYIIRDGFVKYCKELGYDRVTAVEDRESAIAAWSAYPFDALLLDIKLKGETEDDEAGFTLLKQLRFKEGQPRRVFIYSAYISSVLTALAAVASDTIRAFRKSSDYSALKTALSEYADSFGSSAAATVFVGCDEMRTIEASIPRIVATDLPVLLLGGTGDGKTMLAKRIAKETGLPESRIETINCAAIPEQLFEGIFFGHMKGSFTGATDNTPGKLMVASGFKSNSITDNGSRLTKHPDGGWKSPEVEPGIVILDELGALPLHFQAKLLSVLDGEPIKPVGYNGIGFHPHFRVFAATNEEKKLRTPSEFRIDLRKRFEGWVIHMPPIHKQEELIRQLIKAGQPRVKNESGFREAIIKEWNEKAVAKLVAEATGIEGGVRELKNIVARAVLYTYFDGKDNVSVDAVTRALAQRLPSEETVAKGNQPPATKSHGAIPARLTCEEIVEKLKAKLQELGVTNAALVSKNVKVLDYTEVGEALSRSAGEALVEWIKADASLRKKRGDGETEANFLTALGYRGNNKNPRGTIYGNWMKRSEIEV